MILAILILALFGGVCITVGTIESDPCAVMVGTVLFGIAAVLTGVLW